MPDYMEYPEDDCAGNDEFLCLAAFLRGRFGGLTEAFHALDVVKQGHLAIDEFRNGLRCFGYSGNVEQIFYALDRACIGYVSRADFVSGFVDRIEDSHETSCATMVPERLDQIPEVTTPLELEHSDSIVECGAWKKYMEGDQHLPMQANQDAIVQVRMEDVFVRIDQIVNARLESFRETMFNKTRALDFSSAKPICSMVDVETMLSQRLSDIQADWGSALEEERVLRDDRATALGRALGRELKESIAPMQDQFDSHAKRLLSVERDLKSVYEQENRLGSTHVTVQRLGEVVNKLEFAVTKMLENNADDVCRTNGSEDLDRLPRAHTKLEDGQLVSAVTPMPPSPASTAERQRSLNGPSGETVAAEKPPDAVCPPSVWPGGLQAVCSPPASQRDPPQMVPLTARQSGLRALSPRPEAPLRQPPPRIMYDRSQTPITQNAKYAPGATLRAKSPRVEIARDGAQLSIDAAPAPSTAGGPNAVGLNRTQQPLHFVHGSGTGSAPNGKPGGNLTRLNGGAQQSSSLQKDASTSSLLPNAQQSSQLPATANQTRVMLEVPVSSRQVSKPPQRVGGNTGSVCIPGGGGGGGSSNATGTGGSVCVSAPCAGGSLCVSAPVLPAPPTPPLQMTSANTGSAVMPAGRVPPPSAESSLDHQQLQQQRQQQSHAPKPQLQPVYQETLCTRGMAGVTGMRR